MCIEAPSLPFPGGEGEEAPSLPFPGGEGT